MGKRNKCTLKDVAEKMGVAVYTVSRALNGKKDISDDLRDKIKHAASQMGYVPNSGARTLREGCSKNIAVVYDDFQNPFYNILLSQFADKLRKRGYGVTIFYDFESISLLHEKLLQRVLSANVDGIISMIAADNDAINLNKIWKKPMAIVTTGDNNGFADCFEVDDFSGAVMAMEHLIGSGCKKIGFINASSKLFSGMRRYEGYKHALKSAGMEADENLVCHLEDTGYSIYKAVRKLLDSGVDAIFAFNDVTALSALREIKHTLGADKVRVVGFDGIQSQFVLPLTLTTIQTDFASIAQDVVNKLIARIEGDTSPYIKKVYPVTLVKGDT